MTLNIGSIQAKPTIQQEAREWIARGYSNKVKVQQLRELITKKRGAKAADELIAEMRNQYKTMRK